MIVCPVRHSPSTKGINKRVSRMEVAVEDFQIIPQEDRWTARAQIKGGFSIHNLFKAIQTYAVALMLGIVAALIWANVAPENYTYWFGACVSSRVTALKVHPFLRSSISFLFVVRRHRRA